MRITALNQIFGMLAVSPNPTLTGFGKDGSAKDAVVVLKNPPMRPAGLRQLPLSALLLNEKIRATPGGQRARRYDANQLTEMPVAQPPSWKAGRFPPADKENRTKPQTKINKMGRGVSTCFEESCHWHCLSALARRQHQRRWPRDRAGNYPGRGACHRSGRLRLFLPPHVDGRSRKQFTNVEPGKEPFKGPMNTFVNVPEYPPADFKGVVRSNFDTLYSASWLDMTKEPVVISVPDTDGRYYLLPMLDMWTDVFASPGWRTTGTKAGTFLITPAGWRPDLRDRFAEEFKLPKDTQRIEAPTPFVWVIGRTKTDGPADYAAVHKIQAGYKVTPLSEFGKTPKPVEFRLDPSVDMKTPPKVQVDTMTAGVYFAYAAELLKLHPPHSPTSRSSRR